MNVDNIEATNKSSINVKKYYPPSITILLNTRILGHTKEIYNPNMTLPSISSSSKTVYFNPLIKLDQKIVQTIPKGKTDDFLYEQFFNSSYFNSLLIRSQYYPQPKRTLQQATEEGIVDNNIKILLDILFNTNKPFYFDKKRYTSYGYTWNKGDWIIESTNSSKIIKNFNNYYQQSNIYTSPRYNMPTASAIVNPIVPSAPMIVPTATTLYQPNQLIYPNVGQSNMITYHQPILQSYPYQSVVIPNTTENPMFESFDKFEENVDENILHGSSASSTFGDIIEEQQKTKQQKKTRISADKEIASQGQIQQKSQSQTRQVKNAIQPQAKKPLSVVNYPINKSEYQSLIEQFLFYALDGFKNGFISGNRIKCSQITSVVDLKKIQNGTFYNNKIQPWLVLSNDGNGDCLFYVFCQLLNSSDYKVKNSVLKNRKNTFTIPNNVKNIAYYDTVGNYTVAGLRNLLADFILYDTEKGKNIGDMLITRNTNNPADQYIVPGDLNKTLNNMRTCADEKNRVMSKQKALSDVNKYYWGDETVISIIEYIFQLKTILIHKPKVTNNKIEIYNANDTITKNLKTTNNGDYIEVDYMENNSSIKVEGYLLEKKFSANQGLQSITVLKNIASNSNPNSECKYEKTQIDNNNNVINIIHKIEKYKIYNNTGFDLDNSQQYQNYVYILNHDENHYEAVCFNIRGNMRCVFNDIDIFNFHPYIIYMIFIYAYMIATPTSSPFYTTTLQKYLVPLYNYYSYNSVIKNNRLLLGGAVGAVGGDPSLPNTNNSYYGQFNNYVNDKLNQQLSIDGSGKNIPQYYANPNLSYYVVVDLELFPGDKISDIDKRNLNCQIRFDNIRKSYADLLGYQYQPSLLNTNVMPTRIDSGSTRKSASSSNNNSTKKNGNGNNSKNGNRNTRRNRV